MTASRIPEGRLQHNLPAQPTPFVGRDQELAELRQLLEDPGHRLVTILGPGGMGKTRLALAAAQEQLTHFADGSYFVRLAPLNSAENIVTTVADTVGLQFFGASEPEGQLFDYVRTRAMLLVLDNFEHVLDGARLVSDLLAHGPEVKVLVTSRAKLNLRAETVYNIGGLGFPEGSPPPNLPEYDAVKLFLQTARRFNPTYSLKSEEAAAVIDICRLVQGMPLAIELAAAWVGMLRPAEIAAEIETSLDFLATDMQDMPERLRSIRAVFERSWDLLADDERKVFRRLSVFRGGFTRKAAMAVTGASLHNLTALVNKSLLARPSPSGRYEVHELLRQYASEKLGETPKAQEHVHDRHCGYYAQFLMQREDGLFGGNEQERDVLRDIENIRAAWRWAVTKERIAEIRRMTPGLNILHESQGTWGEGAAIFEWASERLREEEPAGRKGTALGLILVHQGFNFRRSGRPEHGKQLTLEGVSLLRKLGAKEALGWGYIFLNSHGTPYGSEIVEDYKEMARLLHEGLAIFKEARHERGITWTLLTLGNVACEHADYDAAIDYYERGLHAARARKSYRGIDWALKGLADCAVGQGDYQAAKTYLSEVIANGKETGPRLAMYLGPLGEVEYWLGQYSAAWHSFCGVLQITVDKPWLRQQSLKTLLWMSHILKQQDEAKLAAEVLSLILAHPESPLETKREAEELLNRLRDELPPKQFAAAHERGRTVQLDNAIARILRDYEASEAVGVSKEEWSDTADLTARELEILQLVAKGKSNREIGEQLVIAVGTVKWYVSQIYGKLHVRSRTQAIHRARELKLLS